MSSNEASGHGTVADLVLMDEAWSATDNRVIQAHRPAMLTRRDSQFWITSTAGDESSTLLRSEVGKGREAVERGATTGTCYFEWSAPDDADPADARTWKACMPALGSLVPVDHVRDDFEAMPLREFARSHLNQWMPTEVVEPLVDMAAWDSCVEEAS